MPNPFILWGEQSLFNRLYRRFALTETPGKSDAYPVIRSVQPITDADTLLRDQKIAASGTITLAAGDFFIHHTVPPGKRWRLIAINIQYLTGTVTIDGIVINDGTTRVRIVYYSTPPNRVSETFPQPIILKEGWTVDVYWNVSVAGSAASQILYEEEDAY